MNRTKEILSILVLVLSVFATGCKGKSVPPSEKVVVWHWLTDREQVLLDLAKRYKEQTGVDVEFQLYAPSDVYKKKVSVGAQTNSLPDIFGVLGDSRELASFINAQHVENLNATLAENASAWKNTFFDGAINTTYFSADNQFSVPEGYYGIPIDVTTIPLIYNKKLFAKAGLNPDKAPATWDEFLEAGKKLKAAGVTGFVSGWGESWLIYSLATNMAHNVMGAPKVMDTFRGKVPYTYPEWIQVFEAFEKLQKANFVDASLVTLGNKNAEQSFASERSGMTFNGSWAVNVYAGMNNMLEYAPFSTPSLSKKYPSPVWGGAGSVFSVNSKSPNKDKAIAFLKWLTQKEQMATLVEQTKNLPSIKGLDSTISPILAQFAALTDNSIHPNRFAASEDPMVQEVFNKGIQSILIKEKTAVQVAKDIQDMKEKTKGK